MDLEATGGRKKRGAREEGSRKLLLLMREFGAGTGRFPTFGSIGPPNTARDFLCDTP